ncbi:MAG: hypothetical protein H6667_14315 [Ardenticatenaceae bacterium]|nr:hypothetical protein [Ardenticatenaceae bacterium]MCB9444229.1 hypothetical protein [Ardenticatenaceae bacterium]
MTRRRLRQTQPTGEAHRFSGNGRFTTPSLLLLGLIIGLAGSLYYAWIISPVVYTDASPARFSESYKAEYIFLVSQSLAGNGDWEQAQQRLAALDDPALAQTVTDLLNKYVIEQRPPVEIRNLAILAQQLGAAAPAVALFAPTPIGSVTPTPTITPTSFLPTTEPSPTPLPTATLKPTATAVPTIPPQPTSQPTYRLLNQQQICRSSETPPTITVITEDALLEPLPGVEVLVTWDSGSDRFYTGFKPSLGEGAGDFTMSPDTSYKVVLADGSPEIGGLRIETCPNGLIGGWQLTFQNLILEAPAPAPTP